MRKVIRGAARAGANVIAEDARRRCISPMVAETVKVKTRRDGTRVIATVHLKGKGAFIGSFLEWGTAPHFIRVHESQSQGMDVTRINMLEKNARKGKAGKDVGSLVINGKFVGGTVWHPGTDPHPFMRPALDTRERDAVAAAQGYIKSRIGRGGVRGQDDPGDAD